jgi:hypothetical protein
MAQVKHELRYRAVDFNPKDGIKKKKALLKKNEKALFLKEIDTALEERGSSGKDLLVSLTERVTRIKTLMQEREENSSGEFEVDVKKYFKLQSTYLDTSIFDDDAE